MKQLQPVLNSEKVDEITRIARHQYELQGEIAKLNEKLTEKNTELTRVKTVDLPNAMTAAGVRALTLSNGYVVQVEDFVSGYIKEEDKPDAFAWLRANKLGSLVKNMIACSFGMGEDKAAKALKAMLKKNKYVFDEKETVHHQTLQALIRERLREGKALPPSITYTTVPTSSIKRSK